jgi:hypothetical protein
MKKRALTDLNIQEILFNICQNEKTVTYMETNLTALRQDKNEIIQKQREIADFINNPELMSNIVRQLRHLNELKEQHKNEVKSAFKSRSYVYYSRNKNHLAALTDTIRPIIKHAEDCVNLYRHMPVYLKDFSYTSDLFIEFKQTLIKLTEGDAIKQLNSLLNVIKQMQEAKTNEHARILLCCETDSQFNKLSCRISDLIFEVNPGYTMRRVFSNKDETVLKRLRKNERKRGEEEFATAQQFISYSIRESLSHIMNLLSAFTRALQKPFERIQDGLPLYEFALSLTRHYKIQGLPFCFPKILEPGGQTLVKDGIEHKKMMMYDASTHHLSLLQNYALLQLFSQAGLPVAAEEAEVAIVSDIFVQLASGELVLGRFEEEAKEMAAICHTAQPYGLVFFHEVFQSTSFEEIAEPFAHIIKYLLNLRCKVVVVTHNNFLLDYNITQSTTN